MNALARTTADTFIFLGGDTCTHAGSFRPSPYIPLPKVVEPSPFSKPPFRPGTQCSAEAIINIHPHHTRDEPFYQTFTKAPDRNLTQLVDSVEKLTSFDALDEVLVVVAHDASLLDVIDVFPKRANDWREKRWKKEGQFRFLADFKGAMGNSTSCDFGT